MSGGHFDYAYSRLQYFVDDLHAELLKESEHTPTTEEDLVTGQLKGLLYHLQQTVDLMKAIEWYYSGDTGTDNLLQSINTYKEDLKDGTG